MASTFTFSDRFSYPSPGGVSPSVDEVATQTLTEADLLAVSPELEEMVRMVKRYSALLQRTSALEIYNIITKEADPRIALVLSAARRRADNTIIFAGQGAVKEVMFADPDRPGLTRFTNRDLFSDGVRRVSAALTASRLIGQLAQIEEQAKHANIIEKQALDDLNRIIQTWDARQDTAADDSKKLEQPAAFYFQPGTWEVPLEKVVHLEWQSPALSPQWTRTSSYTGSFETWQLVNALTDDINAKTASNPDSPLVAVSQLSGPFLTNIAFPDQSQYHVLLFYPRRPLPGVVAYPLNVRVVTELLPGQPDLTVEEFPINRAPFRWGYSEDSLSTYSTNGAIIVLTYNRLTSLRSEAETYEPSVLYFRNGRDYSGPQTDINGALIPASGPPDSGRLVFRAEPIQPNMNILKDEDGEVITEVVVDIPRLLSADPDEQLSLDNNRYSQVALALLNKLAELNIDALVTGALIRNDPSNSQEACSALELVAWSRQRLINAVVLDILEVPSDIELATGDRARPLTQYSSKARSIMVKNPSSDKSSGLVDGILRKEQSFVLKRKPKSSLWTSINDEASTIERTNWR